MYECFDPLERWHASRGQHVSTLARSMCGNRAVTGLRRSLGSALTATRSQRIMEELAPDEGTSAEEHVRLGIVALDIERARWLVRSYVRARIAKVSAVAVTWESSGSRKSRLEPREGMQLRRSSSKRGSIAVISASEACRG